MAAAGLYAVENNIARLAEDHANARLLAEGLNQLNGFTVDLSRVVTNIVIADVAGSGHSPAEILDQMKTVGVLAVPFGRTRIRMVTHLDVNRDDCQDALERLNKIFP